MACIRQFIYHSCIVDNMERCRLRLQRNYHKYVERVCVSEKKNHTEFIY